MPRAVCALPLVLMLGACAQAPEPIVVAAPVVPAVKLKDIVPKRDMTCPDLPTPPASPTQRASADYILTLKRHSKDCWQRLGVMATMIKDEH